METHRRIVVRVPIDVFEARRATRELSILHGFGARGCQSAMIVASELATNILKHGIEGALTTEVVEHAQGLALRLLATDRGPHIERFEEALRDGSDAHGPVDPLAYWGRRGIAAGLGAIARLSDELRYERAGDENRFVVVILRDKAQRRQPGRR